MYGKTMKIKVLLAASAAMLLVSCEKVSPIGVLVAGTSVEDRVKMSNLYFRQHKSEELYAVAEGGDYTFLVGSDSHLTDDPTRMKEMLQNSLDHDDLLMAHLGDIADTKPEYYILLDNTIQEGKQKYLEKYYNKITVQEDDSDDPVVYYQDKKPDKDGKLKYYRYEEIRYPFFPVVGNHDITHNGWALWSNIFHSSFYEFYVDVEGTGNFDHFIFLDSASGTLGKEQIDLIEKGVLDGRLAADLGFNIRHTFVFSHTNIFRPSAVQVSSTFTREETYYLLDQLAEWNTTIAFCGHVHKWDEEEVGGVHYITLDTMCEKNNPDPGDYLLRVFVKRDGTLRWERVHMNSRKK